MENNIKFVINVGATVMEMLVPESDSWYSIVESFVYKHLTCFKYDHRAKKFKVSSKFQQSSGSNIRFPVEYLTEFTEWMKLHGADIVIEYTDMSLTQSIGFKFNFDKYTDKPIQKDAIAFLIDEDNGFKRGLELQTGQGKTFCAIRAICHIKARAILVVPGLMDQWIESFYKFTDIKKHQIHLVQGRDSVKQLLSFSPAEMPDIIIASTRTLDMWASEEGSYAEMETLSSLLDRGGFSIKVVDEVHSNFRAVMMIEMATNMPHNIYLTATYLKNRDAEKIFKKVFPSSMRYGGHYQINYTELYCYAYSSGVSERKCTTANGYSAPKYEAQLMKGEMRFSHYYDRFVNLVLHDKFLNIRTEQDKALFFFSTIQFIDKIKERMEQENPELKILKFVGGVDINELYSDKWDVILTTYGSCGKGKDIPNLRTVVNGVSTQSKSAVIQAFGRLRFLEDDRPTIFADSVDRSLKAQVRHFYVREEILKPRASKHERISLQ